jgi:hypothetical protein
MRAAVSGLTSVNPGAMVKSRMSLALHPGCELNQGIRMGGI